MNNSQTEKALSTAIETSDIGLILDTFYKLTDNNIPLKQSVWVLVQEAKTILNSWLQTEAIQDITNILKAISDIEDRQAESLIEEYKKQFVLEVARSQLRLHEREDIENVRQYQQWQIVDTRERKTK